MFKITDFATVLHVCMYNLTVKDIILPTYESLAAAPFKKAK